MDEEFDISWFDVKKYAKLNELNLQGWYRQLSIRNAMAADEELQDIWSDRIKSNPIIDDDYEYGWGCWRKHNSQYEFNTYSVMSTPALYSWYNTNHERLNYVWSCCELDDKGDATEEQQALINSPIDLLYYKNGVDTGGITNVTIDLMATDEQILDDFHRWLCGYRKFIGYESKKKNFTHKDMSDWIQWRLLPCLDLVLIALKENKELTQAKVARLVFGDEFEVDIVDRLRRTTIPKAKWLIKDETVAAIAAQLHASA